jgi:hypothetical protein
VNTEYFSLCSSARPLMLAKSAPRIKVGREKAGRCRHKFANLVSAFVIGQNVCLPPLQGMHLLTHSQATSKPSAYHTRRRDVFYHQPGLSILGLPFHGGTASIITPARETLST